MQFQLDPNKRYVEFGGGDNPRVRAGIDVRVDSRPCLMPDGSSAVDFIVDMERPFTAEHGQAIGSAEFDGLVSVYAVEHVSWRATRQLLSEFRRILKDGAPILLVLPNTKAQMEHLLRTQDWEDAGSMLFGGQDYGENAHKAFMSPEYTTKLLQEAGFVDVQVIPTGMKLTDMVVTATAGPAVGVGGSTPEAIALTDSVEAQLRRAKEELLRGATGQGGGQAEIRLSGASSVPEPAPDRKTPLPDPPKNLWRYPPSEVQIERWSTFRRPYWYGGVFGGYNGYWDFPCHQVTLQHVLTRRPTSVLELGCGRGYVTKLLQDVGVIAVGWDFSRHAVLTAVTEVSYADVTDLGRWDLLKERSFDLCLSVAVLDHVPEELMPLVCEGMQRVCHRGLHGVSTAPITPGDGCRVTSRPLDWWRQQLPPGHEVVEKDELERGSPPESFFRGDGKVKLNLGCHATMFHRGWVNVDHRDARQFAGQNGYVFRMHDVREGLPFPTEGVDLIYHANLLDTLTYAEGQELLNECRRVLKPTGVMRLAVPDVASFMDAYVGSGGGGACLGGLTVDDLDEVSEAVASSKTMLQKMFTCMGGKAALYDHDTLVEPLRAAGFRSVPQRFRHSENGRANQILRETLEPLANLSLILDAWPDC